MTLILFLGSVFSPYYAAARKRGGPNPLDHCAVNVALYGPRGKRWAMTERRHRSVRRSNERLSIGPSTAHWDGDVLTIDIDEVSVPLPSRIKGQLRLHPSALFNEPIALNTRATHRWWPIAPMARVELALEKPSLRWSGHAYLDSNTGDEPLEAGFERWTWSRAKLSSGAAVLYDVTYKGGAERSMALHFTPAGDIQPFEAPPIRALPFTGWRIGRVTRADADEAVAVEKTLEDTPFYARSQLSTHVMGERAPAIHESLCLKRFVNPLVQRILPFRMPRAWA